MRTSENPQKQGTKGQVNPATIGIPPRKSRHILKIRLLRKNPQFSKTTSELLTKMPDINNKNTDDKSGYPQRN